MSRMNPTKAECQFDEGRLMQLLVAPIVSEKATMRTEQRQCCHIRGPTSYKT